MKLRHPLAAVLGVAGLVLGTVAAFSSTASAAGELVGTTTFSCQVGTFPAYNYSGQITLTAGRAEGASTVNVVAHMSDMAGVAPVPMNNETFNNELVLDVAGAEVKLNGSGTVTAAPNAAFPMPDLQGTFTSTETSVAVTVKSLAFNLPKYAMEGICTPTQGAALGALTVTVGTVPTLTPTPTPTTTTSPTATPKPSGSPSPKDGDKDGKDDKGGKGSEGQAATGAATFACVLEPIGSEFDYKAEIDLSGYREEAGDPVSLVAKMSDLPGISPVPIEGTMDYTLDAEVGGEKVTLTSSDSVNAPAYEDVAVADLTGEVDADGDELDVAVTKFTFNFPAQSIGAECTTAKKSLGTMVVGSEPVETDDGGDSGSDGGGTTTATGGSTLPATGGGDALPVVVLWALALTLLGAAGLLCVPQVVGRKA